MSPDRWDLLEARIAKLERHNRQLSTGCLVLGLAILSFIVLGASKFPDTVEAQRFVLKSAKGEVRAELGTLDGDYPQLKLLSPNGEMAAHLSPIGISFMDKALPGKLPLAHLGNSGLYFTGKRGSVVMELGGASVVEPQLAPNPEMTIFDQQGHPAWRAPAK